MSSRPPRPRPPAGTSIGGCSGLKKRLSPHLTWELSQAHTKRGPDNKKTVTKRATLSIGLHSAFINLPLKISLGDKSGHVITA